MDTYALVLNAGSSSLKFCVFHNPEARTWRLELDSNANARRAPRISRPGSRVSAWVIPTNEELVVAREAKRLLESNFKPPTPNSKL